jgi:hypothetical protein
MAALFRQLSRKTNLDESPASSSDGWQRSTRRFLNKSDNRAKRREPRRTLPSASTHVRIFADDKLILDSDLPSGENRFFQALEMFEVTATVPSAVLLELNGQTIPPLGAPGASGTITLGRKDLKQASGGNSQP